MLRRRQESPADEGFTLIELVISIAVLGLVMGAISGAMAVALKANKETTQRIDASSDQIFSSTWFAEDVSAANTITTPATPACGSGVVVIEFTNSDWRSTTPPATPPPSPAPTTQTVSYVLRPGADSTIRELHRLACTSSATPDLDSVVARRLSATIPPLVTVSGRLADLMLTAADGTPFTLHGTRRSS
jgi:prepilin-type N-terminal cleavage/methylation domain-containing protein